MKTDKKISISLLLLWVFAFSASSQNITVEGKEWNTFFSFQGEKGRERETYIQFIEGESVIDSIPYKNLYISEHEDKSEARLDGYIREEGEKVYIRKLTWEGELLKEYLLYDFGVQVGDTILPYEYLSSRTWTPALAEEYPTIVKDIDTVWLLGTPRKRIFIERVVMSDEWYSGIGSRKGLTESLYGADGGGYALLCCKDSSGLLYYNTPYTCFFKEKEFHLENCFKFRTIYIHEAMDQLVISTCLAETTLMEATLLNRRGKIIKQKQEPLDREHPIIFFMQGYAPGKYTLRVVTSTWGRAREFEIPKIKRK